MMMYGKQASMPNLDVEGQWDMYGVLQRVVAGFAVPVLKS